VKQGDRVGVGAQARSCLQKDCPDCSQGLENHCHRETINTYGSVYPRDEGKSYGGYATHNRTNAHFVFNIPEGLDSADAAPMLCGGITVYSPLKNYGCGPGKTVGIVGVGGLGHFGVLFAKALGADKVVGISRKADKRDDVLKLGADQYISTDEDKEWAKHNAQTLDLIVCTVSSEKMPLNDYLSLLKTKGTFIQVGYVVYHQAFLVRHNTNHLLVLPMVATSPPSMLSHSLLAALRSEVRRLVHLQRSMRCLSLLRTRRSNLGSRSVA
jgi:alcohol dehydrogenase (NADP+)